MDTNSNHFFHENPYTLKDKHSCSIILAAWKLQTPENYGNIIRIADNIGAKKVIFVKSDFNVTNRKIKKIAGDSFNNVKIEFIHENDFLTLTDKNHTLTCIETANNSRNIYTSKLPDKIILLAGSERKGIPESIIEQSPITVHIPITGLCTSLNVSHAIAVCAFEWVRQKL